MQTRHSFTSDDPNVYSKEKNSRKHMDYWRTFEEETLGTRTSPLIATHFLQKVSSTNDKLIVMVKVLFIFFRWLLAGSDLDLCGCLLISLVGLEDGGFVRFRVFVIKGNLDVVRLNL